MRTLERANYNKAIDLYGQAILLKPDPVFYSNRAAAYNILSDYDKVVEDTTAAISMNPEYVKALNRRAHAYEHLGFLSEALLDYTASCIIDSFRNENSGATGGACRDPFGGGAGCGAGGPIQGGLRGYLSVDPGRNGGQGDSRDLDSPGG